MLSLVGVGSPKVYGVTDLDWAGLVECVLKDPRNTFHDRAEIHNKLEAAITTRSRGIAQDGDEFPPSGVIVLKPFPEYTEATSPAGQLFRASDDGTLPKRYFPIAKTHRGFRA